MTSNELTLKLVRRVFDSYARWNHFLSTNTPVISYVKHVASGEARHTFDSNDILGYQVLQLIEFIVEQVEDGIFFLGKAESDSGLESDYIAEGEVLKLKRYIEVEGDSLTDVVFKFAIDIIKGEENGNSNNS